MTAPMSGRRGRRENHNAPRSRFKASAIQANNTPTMSDNGRPTMLENNRIMAGFSEEPGASNIIGDMRAMTAPIAIAGMLRIVSTMTHLRTGRFFETG